MSNLTRIVLLAAILSCVYASPRICEKCKENNDCGWDRECRNGTCQCPPGETFFDGYCAKRVGAYCRLPADCKLFMTTCKNNKCTCVDHYVDHGQRCVSGVGDKCFVDEACEVDNTFCSDQNMCECKPNFAATPIFTCAPFAHHHDHCEYDSQCSTAVPNTFCNVTDDSQRCDCTPEYFFSEGKCHIKKYVADKCERLDECFTPNSHCENGQCACLPSFEFKEGECREAKNSSMITRPLFIFLALVLLGMKVLS